MPLEVTGVSDGVADAAWVVEWIGAARRRWRAWGMLHAALCGLGAGLALRTSIPGAPPVLTMLAAVAAGLVVATVSRRFRDVRAVLVRAEQQQPTLHNALIAWQECQVVVVAPAVAAALARQTRTVLAGAAWPQPYGRGAWLAAAACVAVGLAVPALAARWPGRPVREDATATAPVAGPRAHTAARLDWTATVVPPPYTKRATETHHRPSRLDVLAGTRIDLDLRGWPPGAQLTVGAASLPVTARAGAATVSVIPATSDVLLVRTSTGDVVASVALVVRPDAPPATRIVAPGADLHRETAAGLVAVRVTAQDDLGLQDLRLRFTKVSGSGESFTFVDGEWPVAVTRTSMTQWTGTHTIDLGAMGLGPGDSIVYHAVAHDTRPGPEGAAESERFLIEITKAGQRTSGEASLPATEERFALSQRMVIQLTERLLERRARMGAAEYEREAQALAMAQRRVRAEFVFMLGGEVEDEVAEAEHSHEVEAGRLDNRGQGELTEAVRQMAQAEARLTDAELREALPYEYRALAAVQAAFGRARYFMRTLPAPVQIDPARRLQGDRAAATSAHWRTAPLEDEGRIAGLPLLARLEALAPGDARGRAALMPALVSLDRANAEWIALVQGLHGSDGVRDVARVLRERLLATAVHWTPVPLPASTEEAVLPGRAERPR